MVLHAYECYPASLTRKRVAVHRDVLARRDSRAGLSAVLGSKGACYDFQKHHRCPHVRILSACFSKAADLNSQCSKQPVCVPHGEMKI